MDSEMNWTKLLMFITLRPRQNGRHFPDDIFKCIFLNENAWTLIKMSLNFVPRVQINNVPALVQIMAWHRPGDKPLSEQMMVCLLTHICVTRPQLVKTRLKRSIPSIFQASLSFRIPSLCVRIKSSWSIDAMWRYICGLILAWRHQAITLSLRFSDIHLTAISQVIPQPPMTKVSLKIT